MTYLSDLERQATDKARRIRDLRGLTPEFTTARDRALEALRKHEALIEAEEGDLLNLRALAAEYTLTLGEPYVPGTGPEGGDMAEAFAAEFEAPEPVIAVADSPQEDAAELVWEAEQAEVQSDADAALIEELFEEGPHTPAEAEAQGLPTNTDQLSDWLANQPAPEAEPTFEHIAAAVQEIASPPPPAPDATEEPELTDEQVERVEERLATPDPIGAAEHEPEPTPQRELETAGVYVNRHNPFKSWMR